VTGRVANQLLHDIICDVHGALKLSDALAVRDSLTAPPRAVRAHPIGSSVKSKPKHVSISAAWGSGRPGQRGRGCSEGLARQWHKSCVLCDGRSVPGACLGAWRANEHASPPTPPPVAHPCPPPRAQLLTEPHLLPAGGRLAARRTGRVRHHAGGDSALLPRQLGGALRGGALGLCTAAGGRQHRWPRRLRTSDAMNRSRWPDPAPDLLHWAARRPQHGRPIDSATATTMGRPCAETGRNAGGRWLEFAPGPSAWDRLPGSRSTCTTRNQTRPTDSGAHRRPGVPLTLHRPPAPPPPQEPAQFCSAAAAAAMARAAYRRAADHTPFGTPILGVAATCALASDPPKRGEHRAYVAACSGDESRVAWVRLAKGARTRWQEDGVVSRLLLRVRGVQKQRSSGLLGCVCVCELCVCVCACVRACVRSLQHVRVCVCMRTCPCRHKAMSHALAWDLVPSNGGQGAGRGGQPAAARAGGQTMLLRLCLSGPVRAGVRRCCHQTASPRHGMARRVLSELRPHVLVP
jgi:hypothetical protein